MTKKLKHGLCSFVIAFLMCFMLASQALALDVPVSQTEHMIDGRQTLTKVYEVGPDVDPATLIEDDFEQNGFLYHMTSITKDVDMVVDEMTVTQEHEVTIQKADEDDARLEALMSMPTYLEYDQDGYAGKLYPVINTLENRETGRTAHSGQKKTTKQYTFNYNDDSLVPTSLDGMKLSSISWSEGAYMPDTAIPESYVATATYTKGYSYSTVDGWTFTMEYSGEVTYESADKVTYTLTYIGTVPEPDVVYYCGLEEHIHTADCLDDNSEAICGKTVHKHSANCLVEPVEEPGFFEKLFGAGSSDPAPTQTQAGSSSTISSTDTSTWKILLAVLCLLLAIAAGGFAILTLVRSLKNDRVRIQARDEESGEYTDMKPIWFNSKTASITIDTLEAPSARHFLVLLKAPLAERLKGKVITIKAEQRVIKHTIGAAVGPDYTIEVNLE